MGDLLNSEGWRIVIHKCMFPSCAGKENLIYWLRWVLQPC